MPTARTDGKVALRGTAGSANQLNAAFINSLTEQAMLAANAEHILCSMLKRLKPASGSPAHISIYLLNHLCPATDTS